MLLYQFDESLDDCFGDRKKDVNIYFHINTFAWPIKHGHQDYWEFTIVTHGIAENLCSDKIKRYTANQMFISTTQSGEHCVFVPDNTAVRYINISVREHYLLNLLDSINPNLKNILGAPNFSTNLPATTVDEIDRTLQMVDAFNLSVFEENNLCKQSVLLTLISQILKDASESTLHYKNAWQDKLAKLLQSGELITYNVSDLCDTLGYSRTHLNLLFKKYYNTTPREYLTANKFAYAKNLLKCTNLPAEVIASKIGYSNPMQFFTTFKKLYGVSPTKFRKSFNNGESK